MSQMFSSDSVTATFCGMMPIADCFAGMGPIVIPTFHVGGFDANGNEIGWIYNPNGMFGNGILPGENSVNWPDPYPILERIQDILAGNWGRVLGLGGCETEFGMPCEQSLLPNSDVGMDIWHNSPQCPHCADLWKQADCTFNGTLKDEAGGLADAAWKAAATGAATARSAGTQVTKGALKEVGTTFTELFGIIEYGSVMLKMGYRMVAGCQ